MASNLDDELLALAGGGMTSGDEAVQQPASSNVKRPWAKASSTTCSGGGKKRRVDNDSDNDKGKEEDGEEYNDDDSDDDGANSNGPPYPLEGIFKDEDDKARIEELPEIERETILAQRRDELASRDRAAQLASMVARQQGAANRSKQGLVKQTKKQRKTVTAREPGRRANADSDMKESVDDQDNEDEDEEDAGGEDEDYTSPVASCKGRIRKSVGASDTRNKKLQELSENRRKKAAACSSRAKEKGDDGPGGRKARRSSSNSEEESEESEGYYETDEDDRKGSRAATGGRSGGRGPRHTTDDSTFVPPNLDDVNRARIGRAAIMKVMYRKGWEDKLVGNFVRVVANPKRDERTGKMIPRYRAYEVVDWKRGPKFYQVDEGKYTDIKLVLQFAKERHEKEILFVSNSDITEDEFQRYLLQAQQSSNRASKRQMQEQAEVWTEFVDEPWTEEDFTEVVKARKEAKRQAEQQGTNGGSISHASDGDGGNGGGSVGQNGAAPGEDVLLADLNERNRRMDRERIQGATRKQAEIRRAAALAAAQREKARADDSADLSQAVSTAVEGDGSVGFEEAKRSTDVEIDLGDF